VRNSLTSSDHEIRIYPHMIREFFIRMSRQWSVYCRLRTPDSLNNYKLLTGECRVAANWNNMADCVRAEDSSMFLSFV